jgi:hypothetical protein
MQDFVPGKNMLPLLPHRAAPFPLQLGSCLRSSVCLLLISSPIPYLSSHISLNLETTPHRLFPINFRLLKLNHHLLGLSPSSKILANSLCASSWRTCDRYCFNVSASLRFAGALNIWFRGKPGSPGIAKLVSSAIFWTSFCASLNRDRD